MKDASSVHVLAFSSLGELLVVESEGDFTFETWQRVHDRAVQACRGTQEDEDEDMDMEVEPTAGPSKEGLLRNVVQEQIFKDQSWMQTPG